MADEMIFSASMQYEDAFGVSFGMSVTEARKSITSKKPIVLVQNIGITEEAITLGDVSTPVYAFFRNLDPTNFVELRVATGGAKFARLDPDSNADGKNFPCCLRLGSGATAPYAIADTAACNIQIMLVPA